MTEMALKIKGIINFPNGSSITLCEDSTPIALQMKSGSSIPIKGKRYIVKITSEKLRNGQRDKLFNTGRYVARFNGKKFIIGSLKRERSIDQVSIVGLVNSGR